MGRRPRVCLIFLEAHYWLRQAPERVQAHLASELGVDLAPVPKAADPEATEVLPRVEPDLSDPPTNPLQTLAIPPTPRFRSGRPDRDHGGAGVHPAVSGNTIHPPMTCDHDADDLGVTASPTGAPVVDGRGARLIQAAVLVQPLLQAMMLGQTVDQLAHQVLYVHPALSEILKQALLEL